MDFFNCLGGVQMIPLEPEDLGLSPSSPTALNKSGKFPTAVCSFRKLTRKSIIIVVFSSQNYHEILSEVSLKCVNIL